MVGCCCRQGIHEIEPADVILFEGILAFYFKPLRDLFDVRLFVDLDADTRLAMRGTTSDGFSAVHWPHCVSDENYMLEIKIQSTVVVVLLLL